jgi:hypothetical protein
MPGSALSGLAHILLVDGNERVTLTPR